MTEPSFDLPSILAKHLKWINGEEGGEWANLEGVNLKGANLEGVNLEGVNLKGANLEGVNLKRANLKGANLYGVNLYGANLYGANLYEANLDGANLETVPHTELPYRDCGLRSDGYRFRIFKEEHTVILKAGCRIFKTFEQARTHWTATRGGTALGEESLALVDHAERMARIAGWL